MYVSPNGNFYSDIYSLIFAHNLWKSCSAVAHMGPQPHHIANEVWVLLLVAKAERVF